MQMQTEEKKVRWNIAKAMSCVYAAVHESKLRIKKTNDYKTAMERLASLYDLTGSIVSITVTLLRWRKSTF